MVTPLRHDLEVWQPNSDIEDLISVSKLERILREIVAFELNLA